jgi:WD40 repeat protein
VRKLGAQTAASEQGGGLPELEALVSERLRQRYRIIGQLGAGGLGVVLRAEDRVLGRQVALKTVRASEAQSAQERTALLAEARAAARLSHSSIATIYELAEDEGSACIAMELVEGSTVRTLLEQGPLEVGEAARITLACAEALAAAHDAGIVHCDIKPSNIMVSTSGAVKVLDFGLARLTHGTPHYGDHQHAGDRGRTQPPGLVCGTLGYMAPEQLAGKDVDGRTDIFSLGVVLYEMLTGTHPFPGPEAVASTLNREPVPAGVLRPGLAPELEHIVRRALAKDPAQRYPSACELIAELARVVRTEHAHARLEAEQHLLSEGSAEGLLERPLWALRCQRYRGALLAGIVLGLGGAVAFALTPPIHWFGLGACAVGAAACAVLLVRARRVLIMLPALRQGGVAFRGLLPFSEGDRDRFFGREAEINSLVELVTVASFRFGVLYGESGCGKTSLLRAGVIPRLWDAGLVPLYCRLHRDPLIAIHAEAQRQTGVAPRPDEPIRDYLRRLAAEHSASVVIIFDQFEELFISYPEASAREPFLAFVSACQHDPTLPIAFLISVRSDFLYLIGTAFDGRVDDPFAAGSRFVLRPFTPEQACRVIESSVREDSLPLEEGLPEHLVRDLTQDGRVLPSELQIVGDQLQRRRVLTVREYRAIGGKEALVHGYLEDILRCARDHEAARLVLRSIISEENTRLTLAASEIRERTQRSAAVVDECLRLFVQARLVRALQDEEPWRYELVHEYLIDKVNRVAGKVMDARQRANRLLRQHLSHLSVDPQTRIPLPQLWFIQRYSDQRTESKARALMHKSLLRGALRAAGTFVLACAVGTVALALLSVREEWDERILNGGHTAAARNLAFSPDGVQLISVGEDGRALVWDFPRRELVRIAQEGEGWLAKVAYSPDGRYFATGTRAGNVSVWSWPRCSRAARPEVPGGEIAALSFSPDSQMLLGGFLTPTGAVAWSVDEWRLAWRTEGGGSFGSFAFPPIGNLAIDQEQRALDIRTGTIVRPASEVCCGNVVSLSPDGRVSVAVNGGGEVIFCDPVRQALRLRARVFKDHGRGAVFSPDGTLAATAAEDIVLWDARTLTKLQRLPCASFVWDLRFSPDGAWLLSSHGDGSILVWNVQERELAGSLNGHCAPVRSVAFSPDGRLLASSSDDLSVIVWEVATGRKLRVLSGHKTRVNAVTFAADSHVLYSVEQSGEVFGWNLTEASTHGRRIEVEGLKDPIGYDLAVSPDGALFASSEGVFDRIGRLLLDSKAYTSETVYGVSFSHRGTLLAMCTGSGSLFVADVGLKIAVRGQPHKSPSGMGIMDVAFSPDDKSLVTADDNGEIWLWDVEPLRPVALVGRHATRLKSVAFSPDGRRVVSAGNDAMIALWDVRSRRQLARVGTFQSPVFSVAYAPNGEQITAAGFDGTVRTYTRRRTLWGHTLQNWSWL